MAVNWLEKITDLFFVRASPENPSTSLSKPSEWLLSLFSPRSKSGVAVNKDNVISLSAVYRAVNLIAGSIASMPFDVIRETPTGAKVVDKKHPLQSLLHYEPNPLYTKYIFIFTWVANTIRMGNGYAIIERDSRTKRPRKFTLVDNTQKKVEAFLSESGNLFYKVEDREKPVPSYDMMHLQLLGSNGLAGLDPNLVHMETFGFGLASRDYGNKYYKNGAHLGGYVKHPTELTDEQYNRLVKSWNNAYAGLDKAGKTAVLEEGAEYVPLGTDPEKAQMLKSQQFNIEDVSRITGVPPHLLSQLGKATYNNMEQLGKEFATFGLRTWVEQIEQEVDRKAFRISERGQVGCRLDMSALMRADTKARAEYIDKGIKGGWLSINDARKMENMNPVPGGDTHFVPLNVGPLQPDGTVKTPGAVEGIEDIKLKFETLKGKMDAYGVAVRAGGITPQQTDEAAFRSEAGLPAMSEAVNAAWDEDEGYRRPITLKLKQEVEKLDNELNPGADEEE